MAFRIITVPFDNAREVFPDNELNNFLLDKKVRSYRVEFSFTPGGHTGVCLLNMKR